MTSNLRWKLIAILVVVALAVVAFYPPKDKVKLGLDLKGGVHLVLRVQTDDALKLETETSAERLRDELSRQGVTVGAVTPQDVRSFRVEGVPGDRDADFRRVAEEWVGQVFDRSLGCGRRLHLHAEDGRRSTRLRQEAVAQALQTIERRVNELGVAEPIVAPHGDGDQILVQMPGVTDVGARQGDHPVDGAARAEDRRGRPGARRARRCLRRAAARCRPTSRSSRAPPRPAAPARSTTWSSASPASPAATCATPGPRSTRTTSRPSASRSTSRAPTSSAG